MRTKTTNRACGKHIPYALELKSGKNRLTSEKGTTKNYTWHCPGISRSFFDEKRSHPISNKEAGFGIADEVPGFEIADEFAGFGIADDVAGYGIAHDVAEF